MGLVSGERPPSNFHSLRVAAESCFPASAQFGEGQKIIPTPLYLRPGRPYYQILYSAFWRDDAPFPG